MTYTVGSLFSGIGGLDLAAHWAGFTTSWFVEREPFCQKVLAKHWPGVPCHSDVFECHDLPHVDVIVGGFPCQPFSVAGNQDGDKDERYLLPEMLRIIREVKPYAVLFENVPGFPTLDDGYHFKYLLREITSMGYDAEWGHPRAEDCGAPHKRERWFCVAYAESERNPSGFRNGDNRRQGADSSRERFGLRSILAIGSETMANPVRDGNGNSGGWRALHHTEWDSAAEKCRRVVEQHGVIPSSESLGNADSSRRQKPIQARQRAHTKKNRTGLDYRHGRPNHSGWQRGQAQRRLGGTPDGLPGGLDFVGWPARPGEDQYPYEPSRVTSAKTPDRAARLKALGNAVVPQVAYPLFVAIHEWLTARGAEQVA